MFFSLNHVALRNSTAGSRPWRLEPLVRLADLVALLRAREEPLRVLEEDGTQLARLRERREPVGELRPDLLGELVGQVLGVDPRLRLELRGQRIPDRLRQPLRFRGLAGEQRVGLDVEHEVRRRPLDPQLAEAAAGQGVVRGVHLDHRESGRVVLEAFLRGVGGGGIEHAGRGHRRIGPRCRADADRVTARTVQRLARRIVELRGGLEPLPRAVGSGVVGRVEVRSVEAGRRLGGGPPAGPRRAGRRRGHVRSLRRDAVRRCQASRLDRPIASLGSLVGTRRCEGR